LGGRGVCVGRSRSTVGHRGLLGRRESEALSGDDAVGGSQVVGLAQDVDGDAVLSGDIPQRVAGDDDVGFGGAGKRNRSAAGEHGEGEQEQECTTYVHTQGVRASGRAVK